MKRGLLLVLLVFILPAVTAFPPSFHLFSGYVGCNDSLVDGKDLTLVVFNATNSDESSVSISNGAYFIIIDSEPGFEINFSAGNTFLATYAYHPYGFSNEVNFTVDSGDAFCASGDDGGDNNGGGGGGGGGGSGGGGAPAGGGESTCGDESCDSSEDCNNCVIDCGECDVWELSEIIVDLDESLTVEIITAGGDYTLIYGGQEYVFNIFNISDESFVIDVFDESYNILFGGTETFFIGDQEIQISYLGKSGDRIRVAFSKISSREVTAYAMNNFIYYIASVIIFAIIIFFVIRSLNKRGEQSSKPNLMSRVKMDRNMLILIVFLALLFSFTPLLSRVALDYNLISGLSYGFPEDVPGAILYRGYNICGPCPCPDGTGPNGCSDSEEFGQPWRCEASECGGDGELSCAFIHDCGACGCPDGKVCLEDGYCASSGEGDDSDRGTCMSDGTVYGKCSLTVPLYCDQGTLVSDCSFCGCAMGYYCSEENICLFDKNVSKVVDDSDEDALWEEIDHKFGISERVNRISPLELIKLSETGVRYSASGVTSEKIYLGDVSDRLTISEGIISETDERVREIQERLRVADPDDLEDLFVDENDVIGGEIYEGIFDDLVENLPPDGGGGGFPQGSPPGGDFIEDIGIPCVSEVNGFCNVGGLNCCEGLDCMGGVCLSNEEEIPAESLEGDVEEDTYGNRLVLHDDSGFSNLIDVDVLEGGNERDIKVYKYTTYPSFVTPPDIENAVSFGVYDISLNDQAKAYLSFDILNDLLVLNQVESLAVYRYTDDHWETLDLVDAFTHSNEKTRLQVLTNGFSFFSVIGQKQDLTTLESAVGTEKNPLWSIYRRSYAPGVAVLEVFFGEDKLIFGSVFNEPFIDLVINS